MSNALKQRIGISGKQIISQGFGYRRKYQASAIISSRACLGVDTSGNNQNAARKSLTYVQTARSLSRSGRLQLIPCRDYQG